MNNRGIQSEATCFSTRQLQAKALQLLRWTSEAGADIAKPLLAWYVPLHTFALILASLTLLLFLLGQSLSANASTLLRQSVPPAGDVVELQGSKGYGVVYSMADISTSLGIGTFHQPQCIFRPEKEKVSSVLGGHATDYSSKPG